MLYVQIVVKVVKLLTNENISENAFFPLSPYLLWQSLALNIYLVVLSNFVI